MYPSRKSGAAQFIYMPKDPAVPQHQKPNPTNQINPQQREAYAKTSRHQILIFTTALAKAGAYRHKRRIIQAESRLIDHNTDREAVALCSNPYNTAVLIMLRSVYVRQDLLAIRPTHWYHHQITRSRPFSFLSEQHLTDHDYT